MSLALLLKYKTPLAIIVLALGLCGFARAWYVDHNAAEQAIGKAAANRHFADSVIAVLDSTRLHRDTVLVHDTVTLTRFMARTDTLRQTVLAHLTDTLLVKQYVATTDSTIHSCTELLHDCAAYRASTTLELAQLRAQKDPAPLILFRPTIPQKVEYAGTAALVAAFVAHLLWK